MNNREIAKCMAASAVALIELERRVNALVERSRYNEYQMLEMMSRIDRLEKDNAPK